jgi:tetratricopeptide (TPR) repeat protein
MIGKAGFFMIVRSLCVALVGLALGTTLFAQKAPSPGAPSPGTPTAPGSPSIPGTNPNNPNNFPGSQTQQQPGDFSQTPMFLTGKVVLEDGTPPPDPVAIQLLCGTTPRTIAYTDHKGNFSVDLHARNSTVIPDASESARDFSTGRSSGSGSGSFNQSGGLCPNNPSLIGASIQANLPGYQSEALNLGARHALDNPDVGTMFLRRRANVEGLSISATSALAPKDAQKALERARADATKQKWADAEKELQKAVAIYPRYAAAWLELGNVQGEQNKLDGARNSYAQALVADPKFVNPYIQLASIAANEKKWPEVQDDTKRLLQLNPIDFPQAWFLNAIANYNLGNKDEAEKSAREGIAHDPAHRFPRALYLLGVLLSQKQDFTASAANLRDYLKYAPNTPDAEQIRKQLADVERAANPEAKKQEPAEAQKP